MITIYYDNGNGYYSYGEALASVIIQNVAVIITLIILGSAIYHYFVKKTVASSLKYVTICLVLTLSCNVIYCGLTAFYVTYNVLNEKYLNCALSIQNVPVLGLSRLFLYLYFISRYVI